MLWLRRPKTDCPCHHTDPGPQNRLLSTHGSFHCGPVYPALGDKLNKVSRLKKECVQGNGDNTERGLVEKGPGASAEGGAGTAYHEADHEPLVFHQSLSCCTWSRSARIQSQSAACCMPCPRKLNVCTLCQSSGLLPSTRNRVTTDAVNCTLKDADRAPIICFLRDVGYNPYNRLK